jgi:excisionase family DNA binding protein
MIEIHGVEMVDVREAAELSRRTPETIRRWVWSGRLSAIKDGNKLFVRRADVRVEGEPAGTSSSLADWVRSLPTFGGPAAASASDLVLEDRASRAGR